MTNAFLGREDEIRRQMESLVDQIEIVKAQAQESDLVAKKLEEQNQILKNGNNQQLSELQEELRRLRITKSDNKFLPNFQVKR